LEAERITNRRRTHTERFDDKETLVVEADDRLKKSVIQKVIEQASVAQALLEVTQLKIALANKSLTL